MIKRLKVKKYSGGGVMDMLSGIAGNIPMYGQFVQMGLGMVDEIANKDSKNQQAQIDEANNLRHSASASRPQGYDFIKMALGGNMLKTYNSPTHDNGGQLIDANGNPTSTKPIGEIEKDEPIHVSDKGNYAFSPNLVDKLTGKTFAESAKKIDSKYKKQIENADDISRRTQDKEFTNLQKANDIAKAEVEQKQAQLMQMLSGGSQVPQLANGGDLFPMPNFEFNSTMGLPGNSGTTFFNAGIEGANLNNKLGDYIPEFNFDVAKNMYAGDESGLQTKMKEYLAKTGDSYNMGKIDGDLGKMSKGFFDDPIRSKGFAESLGYKTDVSNISGAKEGYYNPRNYNRLIPNSNENLSKSVDYGQTVLSSPTQKNMITPNESPIIKSIDQNGKEVIQVNPNFGKVASVDSPEFNKNEGQKMQNEIALDKFGDGLKTFGQGFGNFAKNTYEGKNDTALGTGLKSIEVLANGIAAFREPEQIKTQYNNRDLQAEQLMKERGQELSSARNQNAINLGNKLRNNKNAMSQAVKFALDSASYNDSTNQEIEIASREKALNDNVAGQLAGMVSSHGSEAKDARNLQEMLQSQTNAVSADAKKTFAESVGNLGEFFSQKGAANKKSKEQLMFLSMTNPNFKTTTDLQEYNNAIENGDINGIVKYVNTGEADLNAVLSNPSLSQEQKDEIIKKSKTKTNGN